ncbi:beta strand repeat-containing protein [Aeoliella sp. SH292]|uniref:beta strand repeat-containing protein n=1 Tax=Aeoliella sp. SH292 TaxID=3454464 RepID=UPI003F9EB7FB
MNDLRGTRRGLVLMAFCSVVVGCLLGNPARALLISSNEIWDGVNNPHPGIVTLANNTYTIPEELIIGSGATLFLRDTAMGAGPSNSITFNFTGTGGLTFADSTSIIDTGVGGRNLPTREFRLNMNANPISGPGQVMHGATVNDGLSGDTMALIVRSQGDVTIGNVDVRRSDAQSSKIDIVAAGHVNIGSMNTTDYSAGGGSAGAITITAGSIEVGNVDARSFRPDGSGDSGEILLTALGAPAYSPGEFNSNFVAVNSITLKGAINNNSPAASNPGGNLSLTAAKVVLANTFDLDLSENGEFTVNTGREQPGFTQADTFMNMSSETPDQVLFNVFHDGVGPPVLEWANNASGNWRVDGNWTPASTPGSSTQTAVFGSAITESQTIYMNSATTVKKVQFNTSSTVAIGGVDTLTLEAATGNAEIEALQGSHQIQLPLSVQSNAVFTAASGAQLDVNNVVDLNGNTLTIAGDGTVNLNNAVINGNVLVTGSLSTLSATDFGGDLVSVGSLVAEISGNDQAPSFAIAGLADIGGGSLIVDLADGFMPAIGQEFVLLTADTLSAEGLTLSGSAASMFRLVASSTQLTLVTVPEPSSVAVLLAGILGYFGWRNRRFTLCQTGPRRASALVLYAVATWSIAASTSHAQIVVSGLEVWDGINNPHAAQGVTLSNNVYTIPQELIIGSNSQLFLSDPFGSSVSNNITFNFTGNGGLTFTDETSLIDTYVGSRNQSRRFFTLEMNDNDVSVLNPNAGRILNGITVLGEQSGDSMTLVVNSQGNFTVGEIDLTRDDAQQATIDITAFGHVDIGKIISSDKSGSAGGGLPMYITAKSMTLGDIDTLNNRVDGAGANGDINLVALGPPDFLPGDFSANTAAQNVITLNGSILTNGQSAINQGGSLNVTAVKVVLGSDFSMDLSESADFNVNAGTIQSGFTAGDLFMNMSGESPDTLEYTVFHDGSGPSELVWANGNSGNWHVGANWNLNAIPNANTQTAVFGNNLTASNTIFTNQATTVKGIRFDASGGLALAGPGTVTLDADTGSASVEIMQGVAQVQVAVQLADDAVFSAAADSELSFNNTIAQNGNDITVTGGGLVNINHNTSGGGIINNGTLGTAGSTTVGGSLTSTGTLHFDIAGTGNLAFDSWLVTGAADIDGTVIDVQLAEGFTLTGSESFTLLTASSLSAVGITLSEATASMFSLSMSATQLILQATNSGSLVGDYNNDGLVNLADYTVWRDSLGGNTALPNRDPSLTGPIGAADYTIWKSNFGNTGSLSAVANTSVPEPSTMLMSLLAFSLTAISLRR